MHYELMLPHQIRAAIDARWLVVLPLGVLEYHGEHMSVGMDTLAVTGILDILDREMNLVILPPFYYGAASYATQTQRHWFPSPRLCSTACCESASETYTS